VLLAANHVTYVDGFILAATLARPVRFVMYYKFGELPIVGKLLRWARVIPIAGRNENPEILRTAMDQIAEALDNGKPSAYCPRAA
jgi:1-acyl-sn-glycerol-3-phosphate acyltransferase